MTLDQINSCLKAVTRSFLAPNGTEHIDSIDMQEFAHLIATLVREEMLSVAKANTVVSNDAYELYKDLQAYDRFERGLNF